MFKMLGWSVKFLHNRRKYEDKDKYYPVEICIIFKGKPTYRTTGIQIYPNNWQGEKVIGHPLGHKLNQKLGKIEYSLSELIIDSDGKCTIADIDAILGRNTKQTFNEFFREELEKGRKLIGTGSGLSKGTLTTHTSVYNNLNEFNPKIKFSEFNELLAYNFVEHLKTKLAGSTIINIKTVLGKYLEIARIRKLYTLDNPFSKIKVISKTKKKESLTLKEVEKIASLELPKHLEFTRDLFLFSCYTGLAFIDTQNIDFERVKKDNFCIASDRQKKETNYYLNLNLLFWGRPKQILEKHKSFKINYSTNRLRLIDIAGIADLSKKITMHVGRATCASYLDSKGMNEQKINYILGWAEKGMKSRYVKLQKESIDEELRRIFK